MLHETITEQIIGGFYDVHHELGHGFLESVYEGAMVVALERRGLRVVRQAPIVVYYSGHAVGDFRADLLVENRVIVELKACRALEPIHEAQVLNYLRATVLEVSLILHFSFKPVFRRLILTNDRKPAESSRGIPRPSVVRPPPSNVRLQSARTGRSVIPDPEDHTTPAHEGRPARQ